MSEIIRETDVCCGPWIRFNILVSVPIPAIVVTLSAWNITTSTPTVKFCNMCIYDIVRHYSFLSDRMVLAVQVNPPTHKYLAMTYGVNVFVFIYHGREQYAVNSPFNFLSWHCKIIVNSWYDRNISGMKLKTFGLLMTICHLITVNTSNDNSSMHFSKSDILYNPFICYCTL